MTTVVESSNRGDDFGIIYIKNEQLWNETRDILLSKLKEMNYSYICINRNSHTGLNGKTYRLFFTRNNYTSYLEKLTDVFTEEEAEKIDSVFRYKVLSVQLGNTLMGANTLVFNEYSLNNSFNAIFYTNDEKDQTSTKRSKIFQIKEQWYLYHER